MKFERGSGILLHITSLPGKYGIGELGQTSHDFINFLAESEQSYWQILPVGPTSPAFDNSPYMSQSAFAGNPLLIDPELLIDWGFLDYQDVKDLPVLSEYYVEYDTVQVVKEKLLHKAFKAFQGKGLMQAEYGSFCDKQKWLDDYALFVSLRDEYQGLPWYEWPHDIAVRKDKALKEGHGRLSEEVLYHKFLQFCFFMQWERMHQHALRRNIRIIGDIPFYVALDSADVWTHQDCFRLDPKTLQPTHISGVPPDYFSETGQRWGNPIYKWKNTGGKINKNLVAWWQERFDHIFTMVDITRIDHFRGFEAYWEIPAEEETAVNGKWKKGPGVSFFREMMGNKGSMPIIAEDLGVITPPVEELRDACGFPGMKILQFAFDSDENNPYLPHNYTTTNCVVFTGTHDNDTTLSWYLTPKVSAASKVNAMRYANSQGKGQVHWDFIRMAFSSIADIAIIPLQDVLGFGGDCRMNQPSTTQGNWRWRVAPRFLTEEIRGRLRSETLFYNRRRRSEDKGSW